MFRFSLAWMFAACIGVCFFTTCLVVWEQTKSEQRHLERRKRLEQLDAVSSRVVQLEEKVREAANEVDQLKGMIKFKDDKIDKLLGVVSAGGGNEIYSAKVGAQDHPVDKPPKAKEPSRVEPIVEHPVHDMVKSNALVESNDEFCPLVPTSEADIDMQQLYEDDPFADPVIADPWKQGFKITPDASKQITVYIVPHSHNDPGWIKTFQQYFTTQTKPILDTVIQGLVKDPRRRFIWAEISFFSAWWHEATAVQKETAIKVIKNGQLEIVTSGWVMPDEANTHWYSLVDQLNLGNTWVDHVIGAEVKRPSGWAIDPFGHSSIYAWLLQKSGLESQLIQRTHYAIKRNLARRQSLEFKWRQDFDSNAAEEIVTHMMPFYSYDVPHTCGPDPKVCCQFDFARMRPVTTFTCPWGAKPATIERQNLESKAATIIDQWRKKAALYKTGHVLVPLGDDFRYQKSPEFEAQFTNFEKIIDYTESKPELNVKVKFATLKEYFAELPYKEDLPVLQGDFFTYADRLDHYWSGYFTTRPYYKNFERLLANKIYVANLLTLMDHLNSDCVGGACSAITKDTETLYKLSKARAELGIFQHHDGITGTARSSVVEDYGARMRKAENLAVEVAKDFVGRLSGAKDIVFQDYQHDPEIAHILDISEANPEYYIIVQNQNAHMPQNEHLQIYVNSPNVQVFDGDAECIGQVENVRSGTYRLVFQPVNSRPPPLGFTTYRLKYSTDQGKMTVAAAGATSDLASFDKNAGALSFKMEGLPKVSIEVLAYTSRAGKEREGAYLFLPEGEAKTAWASGSATYSVQTGPLRSVFNVKVDGEIEYDLIHSHKGVSLQARTNLNDHHGNKNVALRFTVSTLDNSGIYTDMNGINFNFRKRQPFAKIPIQGQFYPMPAGAYIEQGSKKFGVVSQQPLAVGSLHPGQIDIILDRRLNQDDNRGLAQPIKDNRFTVANFALLSAFETADLMRASTQILRPPMNYATKLPPQTFKMSMLPEDAYEFPCNLELGGVFLPSYFEEYDAASFGKSKILMTLRSYESRRSCENAGCRYEQLRFEKLFGVKRQYSLKAANLLGREVGKDALADTSPLQSYVLA